MRDAVREGPQLSSVLLGPTGMNRKRPIAGNLQISYWTFNRNCFLIFRISGYRLCVKIDKKIPFCKKQRKKERKKGSPAPEEDSEKCLLRHVANSLSYVLLLE